ncbi:MAG: di-trans,poly-cis-decaprenylcistransferase [Parachlamydiaceae bacterium]|nr:di-trans,poly-cis-decaprenylcistransferase [Parachlamydiaceae bacterium]
MRQASLKTNFYSSQQLSALELQRIPRHLTIIPDGNRRWAKKNHLPAFSGHRKGGDNLIEIVKAARELGVKTVSIYLFSTENWSRQPEEVNMLMWLLEDFLTKQRDTMIDYGIKVCSIGDLSQLPSHARQAVEEAKIATASCDDINMVMALNYGSRNEICRAVCAIIADMDSKKISKDKIDENLISQYLDTTPWGDPDLFIRTSGEMRLSNYLLWQMSYAEIYVTEVLWPDFNHNCLFNAILNFQSRDRRLGGM